MAQGFNLLGVLFAAPPDRGDGIYEHVLPRHS